MSFVVTTVALACVTACGGVKDEAVVATASASSAPAPVAAPASDPAAAGTPASGATPAATPASAAVPAATPPGIVVDAANAPSPQPGVSVPMLVQTGSVPAAAAADNWEQDGAFRLLCNWAKMSNDDPIVRPALSGAAHHHTFFGNTSIDAYTTSENIRSKGNTSCRGGTINLSGYWVPSMIDTSTHRPLAPKSLLIYYKTGFWTYMGDHSVIQPLPKGLKMITGNASGSSPGIGGFQCFMPQTGQTRPGTAGPSIPSGCIPGDYLRTKIDFPQCWDGVNLDSPDHKSHMAGPEQFASGDPNRQYRCPASHPVVLPAITFIVDYEVPVGANTGNWRLSSDVYDASAPGGYSLHADWMNGWDPDISELWGTRCMRERRDCGAANLGDGRVTAEFQGN